jgi:hypothetical protein
MRESEVLKQIIDYLNARHIFNMRLNTGAFFGGEEKRWAFRSHNLGPGCADILVPGRGSIWIEVKNEKGKQSAVQRGFEQMVTTYGHIYILARSIDDLKGMEIIK